MSRPRRAGLAIVIFLAIAGAFAGVVLPLFNAGGPPRIELAGLFSTTIPLKPHTTLALSVDNIGTSTINPLCLRVTLSGGVAVEDAVFDNQYHFTPKDGVVCGGLLTGGEAINVVLVVTPGKPGPLTLTVTPLQGTTPAGDQLQRTIVVDG